MPYDVNDKPLSHEWSHEWYALITQRHAPRERLIDMPQSHEWYALTTQRHAPMS